MCDNALTRVTSRICFILMKHGWETGPLLLANRLVVCHRLVMYRKLYNSQHRVRPPAGPSCTSPPQTVYTCTSASLQRAGADRAGLCSHWAPSDVVKCSPSGLMPVKTRPTCGTSDVEPGSNASEREREPRETPFSSVTITQTSDDVMVGVAPFLSCGLQTHIEGVLAFFICATPH